MLADMVQYIFRKENKLTGDDILSRLDDSDIDLSDTDNEVEDETYINLDPENVKES